MRQITLAALSRGFTTGARLRKAHQYHSGKLGSRQPGNKIQTWSTQDGTRDRAGLLASLQEPAGLGQQARAAVQAWGSRPGQQCHWMRSPALARTLQQEARAPCISHDRHFHVYCFLTERTPLSSVDCYSLKVTMSLM